MIGAYSSQLSIPAAAAVSAAGMVYWETGAVADRVTGQGSPLVFRVGVERRRARRKRRGSSCSSSWCRSLGIPVSTRFACTSSPPTTSTGMSVADATRTALEAGGRDTSAVSPSTTPTRRTGRRSCMRSPRRSLTSWCSRRTSRTASRSVARSSPPGLQVKVFMGTTMAQCDQDFGNVLGSGRGRRVRLGSSARRLQSRCARPRRRGRCTTGSRRSGSSAPVESSPDEEGIAGFSAAWVLFADVLGQGRR